MRVKHIVVLAVIAAAVGGAAWWATSGKPKAPGHSSEGGVHAAGDPRNVDSRRVRPERRRRTRQEALQEWRDGKDKPLIDVDEEEVAKLDELEREVLKALREALDGNDFGHVRRSIALMKRMASNKAAASGSKHWSAHLPGVLKQAAVDALDWFGPDALVDLVDFMADEDPDIAQSAIDKFELAMQDPSLADYERADVIKLVSQVIDDRETLDWMLTEATNGRNSVVADTFAFIVENGTDAAKEMVPDYTEMFTGEDGIKTAEDINNWKEANPDDPGDEEFYGHTDID